jgi:hypothetical protein
MRSFVVRYSDRATTELATLRMRQRSAAKRQKHDDARFLLQVELEHDADLKGWPDSENRLFRVLDEYPLRFVFWSDHPNVWIVSVRSIPSRWWHGLDTD